jgi:hypothetical protein
VRHLIKHGFLSVTVDDDKMDVQLMALEQEALDSQPDGCGMALKIRSVCSMAAFKCISVDVIPGNVRSGVLKPGDGRVVLPVSLHRSRLSDWAKNSAAFQTDQTSRLEGQGRI